MGAEPKLVQAPLLGTHYRIAGLQLDRGSTDRQEQITKTVESKGTAFDPPRFELGKLVDGFQKRSCPSQRLNSSSSFGHMSIWKTRVRTEPSPSLARRKTYFSLASLSLEFVYPLESQQTDNQTKPARPRCGIWLPTRCLLFYFIERAPACNKSLTDLLLFF
jgi:hypothetical protein